MKPAALPWLLVALVVLGAAPSPDTTTKTSKLLATESAKPVITKAVTKPDSVRRAPSIPSFIVVPETVRVMPSAIAIERREPSTLSIVSVLLALYGALLSTGLAYFKWRTGGVILRFSATANAYAATEPDGHVVRHLVFEATNRGSRTTELTGTLCLRRFPSWLHAIRGKYEDSYYILAPSVRQTFPFEAMTGKKWVALMRQDDEIDRYLEGRYVYAYLTHSGSDKPARARVRGRVVRGEVKVRRPDAHP